MGKEPQTLTYEEYYGEDLENLKQIEQRMLYIIEQFSARETLDGVDPVIYRKSRIKSPDSLVNKLKKQGFPTDKQTAFREMHDIIGLRIICSFVDNVYEVADWLCAMDEFEVVTRKDYISYPKPNGYRSLHLILKIREGLGAGMQIEIQIRTIAIDFWAALEHQIKYKQHVEHEKTIREELRRCADEIASVDMSMQTIRDVIRDENWK